MKSLTVLVGTVAPDFELPNANGGSVRLSALRGMPVVVIFFRGHW